MRVVLISAPYMDIYGPIKTAAGIYFPLGLGYIASVLRDGGHDVTFVDPEAHGQTYSDLERILTEIEPGLVGIGCSTPNFAVALKIAGIARKCTKAKICVGGVHVSALPKETLRDNDILDFVVMGEGEYTLLELAGGVSPSKIKGIARRVGKKVVINPPRPFIEDVDSIPFPARDLADMDKYRPAAYVGMGKKSATMITSRGCPSRCTFCASHLTLGNRFRPRSPENVVDEIEHLVNDYGIEHIIFEDDTFTVDVERAKKICNLMIERKIDINWYCFSRVNVISRDLLSVMKRSGCYSIGYGVESGNPEILKTIKKGITLNQVRKAFDLTKKFNIRVLGFFMFGLPGDTPETIRQTLDFAKEVNPHMAFFNLMVPYPGTEVFINREKYGFEICRDYGSFVSIGTHAVVTRPGLSNTDLQRHVYKANIEYYLRLSALLRLLKTIRGFSQIEVYVKGGIGLLKQSFAWRRNSG